MPRRDGDRGARLPAALATHLWRLPGGRVGYDRSMAPPPGIRHAPRSAIPRRPVRAFALLGAIGALAACAHMDRYDFTPAGMRREVARRVQIDPADVIVPFEVDESAIARA